MTEHKNRPLNSVPKHKSSKECAEGRVGPMYLSVERCEEYAHICDEIMFDDFFANPTAFRVAVESSSRIAALESERDALKAECERLRDACAAIIQDSVLCYGTGSPDFLPEQWTITKWSRDKVLAALTCAGKQKGER